LTTVLPFGGRHADASANLASMVPKRLGKNARLHRRLIAGQQIVSAPDKEGEFEETIAIPFEGEKLEQLFSMIVRGLVWHHWRVYLADGYAVQTHTVTRHGLHLCEIVGVMRRSNIARMSAARFVTLIFDSVFSQRPQWHYLSQQACEAPR